MGKFNSLEFYLKPGNIVFELTSLSYNLSLKAIKGSSKKLPGKYKIIIK